MLVKQSIMLTEKDYCDYETCVALKELGFKEKTLAYYTSERFFHWRRAYIYDVAIPDLAKSSNIERYKHVLDAVSLYDAQKWLREKMNIQIEIPISFMDDGVWKFNFRIQTPEFYDRAIGEWDSYEEAFLEGIKQAIKILKEEK